jgi:acetylglutamate kinase
MVKFTISIGGAVVKEDATAAEATAALSEERHEMADPVTVHGNDGERYGECDQCVSRLGRRGDDGLYVCDRCA